MIVVDAALRERAARGEDVVVALSGAGFAAQGLVMQLHDAAPGIRIGIITNRTLQTVFDMMASVGIYDYVVVDDPQQADAVIERGQIAVTTDHELACSSALVEVVVEATGEIEHGARVSLAAIAARKHLVLVNAELDATLGPILKVKADEAGVVFTDTDGDQPGALLNLKREAEFRGFQPLLLGNIKSLLDHRRTPETQAAFAANVRQRPKMITSFADGTKIAAEMATLANGSGFGVGTRGMYGPECDHVDNAHTCYDLDMLLESGGLVDYIIGAEPSFGIFVLAYSENDLRNFYMKVYKMGDGPLYTFYIPYHLSSLETPGTIGRAACFGDATLTPVGAPVCDVITAAKFDLTSGQVLDAVGGFTAYGLIDNATTARAENLIPLGLTDGAVLRRDIAQDDIVTFDDVDLPDDRVSLTLWNEQVALFPLGAAAPVVAG
jgi:predicted homoserine dehydrogenase-like protein